MSMDRRTHTVITSPITNTNTNKHDQSLTLIPLTTNYYYYSTGPFRGAIQPMLDLVPKDIHDKCPVIIGSPRDVQRILSYYK